PRTAAATSRKGSVYESIVKRGSLMVVPSGLADSLNLPGIMGLAGAAKVVPTGEEGAADAPAAPPTTVPTAKEEPGTG
ncbi:MAG TPA: hypothetical protein VMN39_00480, partial [Longimicrobiaceae bacterium]|nr:hypothetical protein [Longimicrobiaceae bacterium]